MIGIYLSTDGLDYISSPDILVILNWLTGKYYQYLPTITKILKCICFKCSKLLISKPSLRDYCDENQESRWNKVHALCSKVNTAETMRRCCGFKQASKIKKENISTLIMEWDQDKQDEDEEQQEKSIKLSAEHINFIQ